jgi:Ca-activated chloride channel family protein
MEGSSIAAAKNALLAILDRLNGHDRISLTRFGWQVEHVTHGLEPADQHTIPALKARVQQIRADMGGTEMAQALKMTHQIPAPRDVRTDILLITDGEIHSMAEVVDLAKLSGHRLFTIAIGAAPVEALARKLAEETGGGCEFVAPGEDVEGAILRTFKRLRATPRTVAAVHWPEPPDWMLRFPEAVFPGDTLHLMAGFKARPTSGISVTVLDARGATQVLRQDLISMEVPGDRIARLAAARRLGELPEAEARALALKYQLISPYTSLVVVAERAAHEKAAGLPTVVPVPHMAVAGDRVACAAPAPMSNTDLCAPVLAKRAYAASPPRSQPGGASARHAAPPTPPMPEAAGKAAAILSLLAEWVRDRGPLPTQFTELAGLGVPDAVTGMLEAMSQDTGESEETVIRVFLAMLADALGADSDVTAAVGPEVLADRRFRMLRSSLGGLIASLR